MQEEKSIYRVIFTDENKNIITLHSEKMDTTILGFMEFSKLFFPEPSEIIVTPDDEKIYNLFKDVKKIHIPLSQIIRIEELFNNKKPCILNIVNQVK